jgi:2-isopropylmalate synthase
MDLKLMTKQTNSPNKVEIYDTTLRDGAQTRGIQFSLNDKLNIIALLDEFGIDFIECGWNGTNATDTALFRILSKKHCHTSRLAAFTSSCAVGKKPETDDRFQRGIAVELPAVTLFSKFWDFQIRHSLKTTNEHNLELIYNSVTYCRKHFDVVTVDAEHFFDGFKANEAIAMSALEAALVAGADRVVLCDTNGGTLPTEIEKIVAQLIRSYPQATFGIHCHNDIDLAVANSIVAVEQGVRQVQGTINGIGERCGNTNLCSLIPNLILKYGLSTRHINQHSLKELNSLAKSVAKICRRPVSSAQPYVGDNAFTHKAGVHISSVLKYPGCYEHIAPQAVGNKRNLPLSEQSGRAAVKYRLNAMGYGECSDDLCQQVLDVVKNNCYHGVLLDAAEASLELLVHQFMHEQRNPKPYLQVEHFSVTELFGIHSSNHYRLEIALNINGDIHFLRDFGDDLQRLCNRVLKRLLQNSSIEFRRLELSLSSVEDIDDQFRAFVHVLDAEQTRCICTVEQSENQAICRAYIDAYLWDSYRQLYRLQLAEIA